MRKPSKTRKTNEARYTLEITETEQGDLHNMTANAAWSLQGEWNKCTTPARATLRRRIGESIARMTALLSKIDNAPEIVSPARKRARK